MTEKKLSVWGITVASVGLVAIGAGIYARHAIAEGIPSPNALYYSGVLEEAGVPVCP